MLPHRICSLNKVITLLHQVSRRLARKIQKELRAQRFGYVKLAVRAYMHLLEALKNDDSSLFAKEIVVQPVVCA